MLHYLKDNLARRLLKGIGINVLSKEQTIAYLQAYQILNHPGDLIMLEEVRDLINIGTVMFERAEVSTRPTQVYQYKSADSNATLLPCGALLVDSKVFNTDYHRAEIIRDIFKPTKRVKINAETVIAPWHHYFDSTKVIAYWGYYDYLIYIAAKICRIKDALNKEKFDECVVSYPLVGTTYEQEFLQLIGFNESRVIDSRSTKVTFKECILGNSQDYSYLNMADILSLKKHILSQVKASCQEHERDRIYISRSGTRKVINESNLIRMLEKYNFKIIEDKYRSLSEQVSIYKNASFILGPHGASFTNILWCEPGTHLFELFSANYAPNYFFYLAKQMNLQYSAYAQDTIKAINFDAEDEDMFVSIPDVEARLNKILEDKL